MKSSNKILLFVVGGFFLAIIVAAIIVRINYFSSPHPTTTFIISAGMSGGNNNSGDMVRNFNFTNANNLKLNFFGKVVIKPGEKSEVLVNGADALTANVRVDQSGDTLIIDSESEFGDGDISVVITTARPFKRIEINGAAKLDYSYLKAEELFLRISGASHCYFSGQVTNLKIENNGMGHINAKDLIAENVDLASDGMSNIQVYAVNNLKLAISGMARIKYYGNPKHIIRDVSGVASISNE